MFKKKFKSEFEFINNNTLNDNQSELQNFASFIIVAYSKNQLAKLLKSNREKQAVIICLFDTQINGNTIFLKKNSNLLLLGGFKTKSEIIKRFTNTSLK